MRFSEKINEFDKANFTNYILSRIKAVAGLWPGGLPIQPGSGVLANNAFEQGLGGSLSNQLLFNAVDFW